MFNFIVIDPRKPVVPPSTLGIEVTIPEIAALCDLGNIDPQHGCGRCSFDGEELAELTRGNRYAAADFAAIEVALAVIIPPDGTALATGRPDLDAFGAMAVLALRAASDERAIMDFGQPLPGVRGGDALTPDALARIAAIAAADGNTRTTWEPRALPTAANPWPAGASVDSVRDLAAVAAVVSDRSLTAAARVACVAAWLLDGEEPSGETAVLVSRAVHGLAEFELNIAPRRLMREARARVEAERADMIAALEDGRISIRGICVDSPFAEGSLAGEAGHDRPWSPKGDVEHPTIAIVRSAHRAATSLGQSVAPLAICFHPSFAWPQGHATPKATIAWAVPPGAETVTRVIGALNRAERNAQGEPIRPGGWGGNAASGIIGSPQGHASALSEDEIVTCVRGAL